MADDGLRRAHALCQVSLRKSRFLTQRLERLPHGESLLELTRELIGACLCTGYRLPITLEYDLTKDLQAIPRLPLHSSTSAV
ncbi:MAG: hypothetical protein ACK47B_07375 [Armatimonadota bacterium]